MALHEYDLKKLGFFILFVLAVVGTVIGIGAGIYYYTRYQKTVQELQVTQQNSQDVVKFYVEKVGKLIDLPQDESINMENEINDIVESAKNNPDVAKSLCIELQQPFVDQCLLESGLAHNNGYFCPFIDDRNRRDSCYFNIVFATKQTELCEPIVNLYLHDTCTKL